MVACRVLLWRCRLWVCWRLHDIIKIGDQRRFIGKSYVPRRTSAYAAILGLDFVGAVWQLAGDSTLSPVCIIWSVLVAHCVAYVQRLAFAGVAVIVIRLNVFGVL